MQERDEASGEKPKMLGVAWGNLTVTGVGCDIPLIILLL
jgi:hypothetical protein